MLLLKSWTPFLLLSRADLLTMLMKSLVKEAGAVTNKLNLMVKSRKLPTIWSPMRMNRKLWRPNKLILKLAWRTRKRVFQRMKTTYKTLKRPNPMKMSATKLLLRIILKLLLPQNKLFNFLELFKLILLVSFNRKLVSEMSSLFSRSTLSQLLLLLSSQSSVSSLNSLPLHRKSTKANLPRLWTLSNNFCLNSEINKLITNSSTLQLLANSMNLLTISMSSFRTPRTPLPIKLQLLNRSLLVLLNSLTSSAVSKVSLLLLTDNSKPLMILAHHTRQITLRSRAKCKILSYFFFIFD